MDALEQMRINAEQAMADSKRWFADRKRNQMMNDSQSHVNTLNGMQRQHNEWSEKATQASEQRIADYREQAFANIEPAYDYLSEEIEPEYDEPENDIANELLNRMNNE